MLLEINPDNPQERLLEAAVEHLRNDGVIIYPTDTVYGLGCSISSKKGMLRICQIKNMDSKKPLTIVCSNERQIQEYTQGIPNPIFKVIRRQLPGPYTFIFHASKTIPKVMLTKRKTVGIRLPDHPIAIKLVEMLGQPILSCSLKSAENRLYDDPFELHEEYEKRVPYVIDGGTIFSEHSTIIDFSQLPPQVLREGKGAIEWLEDSFDVNPFQS